MLLNVPCARPKRPLSTTTSITVWTRSSIRRARGPVHRWMSSRRSPSTCEEATMSDSSALPLIGAVAAVGILHTVVPDHWVPITLLARQQGWTKAEVARAALVSGTGHTLSTLLIGRGHGHVHNHGNGHGHGEKAGIHGPELARIVSDHDLIELSIFEAGT